MASTNSSALILPAPTPATNALAQAKDIRDIKDPVPIGSWFWAWLIGAALLIAALLYWLSKRKKKPIAAPIIFVPPHRKARERLRGATELLSDPYRFCSLVSDVTRVYLEERFDLHAPDRTTEEFLAEQRNRSHLIEAHKELLEAFLTQCDLVKFARHEPTEPELRALLDSALRLIDETQESETPKPAEAAR